MDHRDPRRRPLRADPGRVDRVAVVQDHRDDRRQELPPDELDVRQLQDAVPNGRVQPRADQLDRDRADRDPDRGGARIDGGLRARPTRLRGQDDHPDRLARGRDVPADLDRRLALQPVAQHRPVRHLGGPDHPVHDVHAAACDLHPVGVLQRDPMGTRTGGPGRRRHALPGVHEGDRAARSAGRLHHGDPRVHLRVERLPLRQHAHLDEGCADRAGDARVLHRRLAVPGSDRSDRRRGGGRDHSDRHHGADIPAPHRGRPHRGRRQGIGEPTMANIELRDVTKRYPDGFEAVKHMDLSIEDGEFIILVGPSGCGKSTALRMIAGLEDITDGEMRIGDQVVNDRAPKDRDIAMVFQNYALYPHMSVRDNMGFALKLAKVDDATINQKVEEAAKILDLEAHLDRKPADLSGAQRERVAMGRAIVRDPSAFLMDEPLSNLDAKLRVQMRTEVSRIQKRLGTTTVYVTHDQTEAMTLGDRVAVMRSGVLQQVDTPKQLYDNPVNLFVAGFIGSPAMNFFPGTLEGDGVNVPFGQLPLTDETRRASEGGSGSREVLVGIRPEEFEDAELVGDRHREGFVFDAPVELTESMGSEVYAYFSYEGGGAQSAELEELAADSGAAEIPSSGQEGQAVARLNPATKVQQGQTVRLSIDTSKTHLFDPQDGRNLTTRQAAAA